MQESATVSNPTGKIKAAEVGIYYLLDQQESDFIKEGTEHFPRHQQIRLKAPRDFRLCNQSIAMELKDGSVITRRIRYIYGDNDIDETSQDLRKVRVTEGNQMDQIYFKHGILVVPNEGITAPLFQFMECNVANAGAPNRNPNMPADYYRYHPEKEAKEKLKLVTERLEAAKLVENLYEDTPGGFKFDMKRINFLCRIMNVVTELPEDKVATLMAIANEMPNEFKTAVKDKLQEVKAVIAEGYTVGSLVTEGNQAVLTNGSRRLDVLTFPAKMKTEDERMTELAQYFVSEEGAELYNQLLSDTNYMKDDLRKQNL